MLTHGKGEKGGRAKREKVLSSISSTNHSSPYHEHPPGNCSICVCTTHSKTDKQTQKLLSWKFPNVYKKPSGIILPVSIAIKSCHILFHPSSLHIWGVGRARIGGNHFKANSRHVNLFPNTSACTSKKDLFFIQPQCHSHT